MPTGSTTKDAWPLRAEAADPDVPELEQFERRAESIADAAQMHGAGSLDSMPFTYLWQLFGYAILDSSGATVGPVARIWTDPADGRLQYLGLTCGRIRRRTRVIPAQDAHIDDHDRSIRVGYQAATIRTAPGHNTDIPLTRDQERKVDAYYDNR